VLLILIQFISSGTFLQAVLCIRIGSGFRVLMNKFVEFYFTAEKKYIFFHKWLFFYLGPYEGRPSNSKSLFPLNREHPALENKKFLSFFIFAGHFCHPESES
jgi:hypothetical protein